MTRSSTRARRLVAGVLALGLFAGACRSSGSDDAAQPVAGGVPAEPGAGSWKTRVLTSADQIKVPAPPRAGSAAAKAELAEVDDLATPKTTEEAVDAPFKVVAPLKATLGSMNYEVPRDIDVARYRPIVIWCQITRNAYAAASIQP